MDVMCVWCAPCTAPLHGPQNKLLPAVRRGLGHSVLLAQGGHMTFLSSPRGMWHCPPRGPFLHQDPRPCPISL